MCSAARVLIVTAHQPAYLPWLGYFHKIVLADVFVLLDQVQYQVNSFDNRNKIKTKNGPVWLSVPVQKKGFLEKTYDEIEIDNGQPWQRKHWASIVQSYKKAAHFSKYADRFEAFYQREWTTLLELNEAMLVTLLECLSLNVRIEKMREHRFEGTKSDLVLDICRQLKADIYVFGAQGKNYADVDAFKRENVGCYFQDYRTEPYAQIHGEFASHMSVIDLLFNCGPNALEILMGGNETRDGLVTLCKA